MGCGGSQPLKQLQAEDESLRDQLQERQMQSVVMPTPSEQSIMQVVVPPGLQPGAMFIVQTPNGQQMPVAVPPGSDGGDTIVVSLAVAQPAMDMALPMAQPAMDMALPMAQPMTEPMPMADYGGGFNVGEQVIIRENDETESAWIVKVLGNGWYAVDYHDGHTSYEEIDGQMLRRPRANEARMAPADRL
jgi:translation initiation factor IF-1